MRLSRDDLNLYPNLETPSLFWRTASHQTIVAASAFSRLFLFALSKTEVNGLPRFLDLLKSRADYKTRRRGLLTVSSNFSLLLYEKCSTFSELLLLFCQKWHRLTEIHRPYQRY